MSVDLSSLGIGNGLDVAPGFEPWHLEWSWGLAGSVSRNITFDCENVLTVVCYYKGECGLGNIIK